MDRPIPKPPAWRRRALIGAGLVAAGGAAFFFLRGSGDRSLEVEGGRLTFATVKAGRFEDFIQVRARVTPLRTTFVDTASGGQVEAVRVEDGARVEKGQLLVELTNTALQLDLISREAQITEQLNNLRGLELAHEQSRLANKREMVEVQFQIARLERQSDRQKQLVDSGSGARGELDDLVEELAYYKKRLAVHAESQQAGERLQRAQVVQLRASTDQLEKNLDIARKNLESLKVRAPADGTLSAFSLEVGQSLAPGERLGQIDDPTHYKLVADIDEFYLSRVDIDQRGEYPVGEKVYQLEVAKIRPQVQNGVFQAELTFSGETPSDVRRGQTAQVRLQLGQPSEAVLVPNGAFYNDTGGTWVFVVSSDRSQAVRRAVRLGRRNPQQIEVLDGLSAGEEIVTSPYTNYLDLDRLDLTETR